MIGPDRIAEENEPRLPGHELELETSRRALDRLGVDAEAVTAEVARFSVAAPSWALGTGGTRFGRFAGGGEPRTIEEKLDDVAALNSLTGANRTISLHIPWDQPEDPAALRGYAAERKIGFDVVNSNTFQDHPSSTDGGKISYKFGSLCHADPAVRQAAVDHNRSVIDVGAALGSTGIAVWLADGTSYPGQANFRKQFERVLAGLQEIHSGLPQGWLLHVEHKPYEPAFYSTVNADWGSSLLLAQGAGDQARCIVDLGHHLPNTNVEQIVSRLTMVGRLGGFHFNDSKYGDDDLTVGAINPYELFLIMLELRESGDGRLPELSYMIDSSHNLKDPFEDLIQATDTLQHALAQACCVDRDELAEAQERNDPAWAAEVLHRATRSDVRPLVAEARRRNGSALEPLATFRAAGYRAAKVAERGAQTLAAGL